ncbi:MAG: SRPBCC domain-containing protein [gamma proteobacterium symbiont of Lucinoma myriamae]|nr:SRPBCC domain-containing protein [gamma proteobacterium symbiont of Lucinoma myriamae]
MTDLTVNVNKTIHASIEKVFDAWLSPKMLSLFMMPMQDLPESDVENDAREGGDFTIIMHAGNDVLPHTGKYLEINRPDKLVFTWVSHCSVDNSIVTLNFTKIDGNKTNISLTHVKFIDEKTRSDHEGGWGNILNKLNDVMN